MTLEEKYTLLKDNPYFDYFSIKKEYECQGLTREELLTIWKQEEEKLKPFMWRYENPFMKIRHFDEKYFNFYNLYDNIIIQEKIDGSNTHVNVSDINTFKAYGQNFELNEMNHLNGFWYYMRDNYRKIPNKYYGLDIYGEWLVPHYCDYPVDKYGEFYIFDVMENGKYWTQDRVELLAYECGFYYAPVLYKGSFKSWKHVMSFVGSTALGGDKGEGVVVKNQTKLNSNGPFYVKIVSPEYQEVMAKRDKVKMVNMDKILTLEELRNLTKSVVTLNRVRKILFKLVDNGEISVNWKSLDNSQFSKKLCSAVYRDILNEEPEVIKKVGKNFGNFCKEFTLEAVEDLRLNLDEKKDFT